VADLYSVCHRIGGPVTTFTTMAEAEQELEAVLSDEPEWADDVWIEPFDLVLTTEPRP